MGGPKETPARLYANATMKRVHDALKPLLVAAGVRGVERQIGRPRRFFQKSRERDALRLSDYLATCATLDREPADLLAKALEGRVEAEIRRPRIVTSARERLGSPGPGLGAERLAELDAALQEEPKKTRAALARELERASREEVPRLLGFYGSCLRVEADLGRAELVLRAALDMARGPGLAPAEPDLLIRLAYVALEQQRLDLALRHAMEATLAYGRLEDREGEGRGYLTIGMFRYYSRDYRRALRNLEASIDRVQAPKQLFSAHQGAGLCWLALGRTEEARSAAAKARELVSAVPSWLAGKLDWLESRLAEGSAALDRLAEARSGLGPDRPADCALVTIQLIDEALAVGRYDLAEREATGLCALIDRTSSPRIEAAILHLIRHRSRLGPDLVARVRGAMERARDRRLAQMASSE
ncbi:MAG: hypothetical protein GY719_19960 [bacterium]|nr:hypothetical protein [bacterium]